MRSVEIFSTQDVHPDFQDLDPGNQDLGVCLNVATGVRPSGARAGARTGAKKKKGLRQKCARVGAKKKPNRQQKSANPARQKKNAFRVRHPAKIEEFEIGF